MNEEDKVVYQRLIYYNDEEHLAKRIIELQHCCKNLQSKIDKAIEILGQYKHLSSPTEEQANEQEEIVSNVYNILKEDK